jgi:anti-repressor protein
MSSELKELVKVNKNSNGELLISARDLHAYVEGKERFSKWWDRMLSYGFDDETDYTPYQKVHPQNYQEITDYAMQLDMAKEIAMIQRSEKGKQARLYFINCEKELRDVKTQLHSYMIEDPIKRAERWIQEQKEKRELEGDKLLLEQQVGELQPKANYVDEILSSKSALNITQIAKDYGMSGYELNKILSEEKVQYKQNKQWLLYAAYHQQGYTKSDTQKIELGDGRIITKLHTKWTQKGRLFVHELLKKRGVIALVDREEIYT